MNNFEWIKKNSEKKHNDSTYAFCKVLYEIENGESCYNKRTCDTCKFETFGAILQYLSQEHKEPIKLKQWEYDLIKVGCYCIHVPFHETTPYSMKEKGHYKGVKDISMYTTDILNNCEIVPDDYDFGGNEND